MILLLGMTGAGKTTFASLASGRSDLVIGTGLDPCTQDPCAVKFTLNGRSVILIDTPGFDDNVRGDVEILEDIGKWMVKQGFTRSQHLDGLILLHPIFATYGFDSDMERKRTRLLQKILGADAYKRVVIATTMWETLSCTKEVEKDISTRWNRGGVWSDFREGGGAMVRHFNAKESADSIIWSIVERSEKAKRTETLLQKELAPKHARFTDTSVGKELSARLEDEERIIQDQLLEHRRVRPPDSWRKSRDPIERWKWKEWDEEYNDLTKNLEQRQAQIRKMNSFMVSAAERFSLFFTSHNADVSLSSCSCRSGPGSFGSCMCWTRGTPGM